MNKEEYYKNSIKMGLPMRCPILNYCGRRALTIYFFSEYYKIDTNRDVESVLMDHNVIPKDFREKVITTKGELPTWKNSDIHLYFHNMCPEVNLFDGDNALYLAKGNSFTDGEWDALSNEKKLSNTVSKHFCECSEFSNYYFENKDIRIGKPKQERNRRNIGISAKLRFEIFTRDNFTCQYCGKSKNEDNIKLELDHKIPVSAGGKDDYSNLITSCRNCNQGKSNKLI